MRRDPRLGHVVHLAGADLHLERLRLGPDHGRVQGLVHVRLGHRDVVVELPGNRPPDGVHDPERRVAVLDLVHQQPDGVDVVDLVELGALALHLLVDAVDVLGAAGDLRLDADLGELLAQDPDALVDEALALPPAIGEARDQLAVLVRLGVLEREVLELPLPLPDPEAMGERRVDLHRLASDSRLLLRRQEGQGAHVVQPVGELDDHHPHVLGHGHEHLPDVLRLLLLHGPRGAELAQLGDPVDQPAHLAPEALLDVGEGEVGILGNVVEERGRERLGIHLQRGELVGDLDRVADVGLSGGAQLSGVRLGGDLVGTLDQADIDARPMTSRLGDDVLDGVRARRGGRGSARDPLHHGRRGRAQAGEVHGRPMVARTPAGSRSARHRVTCGCAGVNSRAPAPELAQLGRAGFGEQNLCLVGTLCADGWPRISANEVYFVEGELMLGMMVDSRKSRDLVRDPRITVMTPQCDREAKRGDFKLYGMALTVADVALREGYGRTIQAAIGWRPDEPYPLWSVEIKRASYISFGEGRQLLRWSTRRGMEVLRHPDEPS